MLVLLAGAAIIAALWLVDDDRLVTEPTYGWTIEVPRDWDVFPVDFPVDEVGVEGIVGLTIASSALDHPPARFRGDQVVPTDGAIVQVIGGHPDARQAGSSFPLEFGERPVLGDRYLEFHANGMMFEAIVWFGERASADVREAAEGTIGTIRFPSLPDPPRGEGVWADPGVALGPAARFPRGAITPVSVRGLGDPFQLHVVHATHGYYSLLSPGGGDACAIVWSADDQRFVGCEGEAWDRHGSPLGDERSALRPFTTTPDWDGDLVVDLWEDMRGDPRSFW